MNIISLTLARFRNYSKRTFQFSPCVVIVGRNATGKTNILEALYFLSDGVSFRAEKDSDVIKLESDFAKIVGTVENDGEREILEIQLVKRVSGFGKKYLVNGISKRQQDFISHFLTVLFAPSDIELLTSSPSPRRRFLDHILIQSDKRYRTSLSLYEKALKNRNRLLRDVKEGKRVFREDEFEYWNLLLVEHGEVIHNARGALIDYLNGSNKDIFDFEIVYDHSTFTMERVNKYQETELRTGITLIGPQRDDILFYNADKQLISSFCSRGEQRLTILQLKYLEIEYVQSVLQVRPILLLDDIFSELDQENIDHITQLGMAQQTLITTTHRELIPSKIISGASLIKL